jgi:hypothetical protein
MQEEGIAICYLRCMGSSLRSLEFFLTKPIVALSWAFPRLLGLFPMSCYAQDQEWACLVFCYLGTHVFLLGYLGVFPPSKGLRYNMALLLIRAPCFLNKRRWLMLLAHRIGFLGLGMGQFWPFW